MNLPEIKSYEEEAIDIVVSVINKAQEKLGVHQDLTQLASKPFFFSDKKGTSSEDTLLTVEEDNADSSEMYDQDQAHSLPNETRADLAQHTNLTLTGLGPPLALNTEAFLVQTIEKKWKLTDTLMYILKYMGGSQDESSQFFYYEAVFSQPTVAYPIPQATASVFFRIQDKLMEPPEIRGVPTLTFRMEGHHTDHDVRYVKLTADWILAIIQMKINFFRRIEDLRIF